MVSELSDEVLNVTYYDDTTLRGNITAKEDGLLFLTIPYAEGFKVMIDGHEGELVPVSDALSAIRLDAGEHEVELKYVPVGFKEGAMISAAGLASFVILLILSSGIFSKVRNTGKVRRPEIPAESITDDSVS